MLRRVDSLPYRLAQPAELHDRQRLGRFQRVREDARRVRQVLDVQDGHVSSKVPPFWRNTNLSSTTSWTCPTLSKVRHSSLMDAPSETRCCPVVELRQY